MDKVEPSFISVDSPPPWNALQEMFEALAHMPEITTRLERRLQIVTSRAEGANVSARRERESLLIAIAEIIRCTGANAPLMHLFYTVTREWRGEESIEAGKLDALRKTVQVELSKAARECRDMVARNSSTQEILPRISDQLNVMGATEQSLSQRLRLSEAGAIQCAKDMAALRRIFEGLQA